MRRLLDNVQLIEGTGAMPVPGASVLVENDTIVFAGRMAASDRPTPGEAEIIDLAPEARQGSPTTAPTSS